MGPLVSVVVPVYNASKYLNENIESLVHQTLKNIEIIYVDDGSTDNSVEIIESYQGTDARIKLLRQKNLHAGVARNTGMHAAIGKYIMFLDADDFFRHEMLKDLYEAAEKHQVDIVLCGHYGYDDISGKVEHSPFPAVEGVFSSEDLGSDIYNICDVVTWNKLINREFALNTKIEFQTLLNSNDEFFTRMIVTLAKRMYYLKKHYPYYRYNNENSLQGSKQNDILCFGEALKALKKALISRKLYNDKIKKAYISRTLDFIQLRMSTPYPLNIIEKLYDYIKFELIPFAFEKNDIIPDSHIAQRINISENFVNYLFGELALERERNNSMVSRSSIDYRVGHDILLIPRKIKRTCKRITQNRLNKEAAILTNRLQ